MMALPGVKTIMDLVIGVRPSQQISLRPNTLHD